MAIRAAVLVGLCLVPPSFAQAQHSVRITYFRGLGAESCPAEPEVRAAVTDMLGYDPFHDDAKKTVHARVLRGPRGFKAAIDLQDGAGPARGVRRLQSSRDDCAQLAAAVVLALAIAIDPLMANRVMGPEVVPRADPEPPPPPLAKPLEEPRVASATSGRLAVSAHAAVGAAPAPALGVALLAGLRGGHYSANAGVRLDLPAFKDAQGGRISGWLALGSLLGCGHRRWLAGCALLGGGVRRMAGHDLENARSATKPVAVLGARVALEIPLRDRVAGYLHADLQGELIETAVLVGGRETWDTPPVSGAAGAGLMAIFP